MGVHINVTGECITARVGMLTARKLILEYPSVGATENLLMAAVLTPGTTTIINAALEPEVLDLVNVLKKMGADITITPPAGIEIKGVSTLIPIQHEVVVDRLEAGTLLLAAAITGGEIDLPQAPIPKPAFFSLFQMQPDTAQSYWYQLLIHYFLYQKKHVPLNFRVT